MSGLPFLLEIGTEEIPDWMIVPALIQLRDHFQSMLDGYSLQGRVSWVEGTPRRLALRADSLIERQPDSEELVTGPPTSSGPGAAKGFAKKMGVGVEDLGTASTAKGEYFSFNRKVAGRAAKDILAAELPGLILKIQWPKAMYWTGGKTGPRFIRPIRWLVALLGDDVVPFEVAGVASGNVTRGHRKLGSAAVPVSVENYRDALAASGVILAGADRRKKIEDEIAALLDGTGLHRPGRRHRRVRRERPAGSSAYGLSAQDAPPIGRARDLVRPAAHPGLHHRTSHADLRKLRRAIPRVAQRGAGDRDAAPSEEFLGRGRGRQPRASLHRRDEHQRRSRRTGPAGQRTRAARPLQRRPFLLADGSAQGAGGSRGGSGPCHVSGQAGIVPRENESHGCPGGRTRPVGGSGSRSGGTRRIIAQSRPDLRDGEGVHRTARCGRRPVREGTGRTGSGVARHVRSLQAGQHGGLHPRNSGRPAGGFGR